MNLTAWRRAALGPLMGVLLVQAACWGRSHRDDRQVLAQVGGTPLYVDDFKRQLARLKLEVDDSGAPPPQSEAAQKQALLEDLINRRLLLQDAEKRNTTVPSDAVDLAYQRVHAGWKDDEFTGLLRDKDLTPGELKTELREMLLLRKYLRDYVFARVAVTDGEIDTYVKEHADLLQTPEEVRARHLVVKTEEKARAIVGELRQGLAFEDAAIKYSLSPDSQGGGDLGFFARGVMPQVFDDTCFALRPGEVSAVVASPYGYHLFKVLERHPAGERSLPQVRDMVEARLRRDKEQKAQQDKLRDLRAAAAVVIKEERFAQIM